MLLSSVSLSIDNGLSKNAAIPAGLISTPHGNSISAGGNTNVSKIGSMIGNPVSGSKSYPLAVSNPRGAEEIFSCTSLLFLLFHQLL